MKNIVHIICITFLPFLCYMSDAQTHTRYAQGIPLSDKIQPHMALTLEDKVSKSDAVVEGMVISGPKYGMPDGFFGPNGKGIIYTSIVIRISRIFKGLIKDTIIELITDGGRTSDGLSTSSNWGFVGQGQEGIFFLRINDTNIQSGKKMQSYFFLYGNSYIGYNILAHSTYHEILYEGKKTSDFENVLYKPIEAIAGIPVKVIGLTSFEAAKTKQK